LGISKICVAEADRKCRSVVIEICSCPQLRPQENVTDWHDLSSVGAEAVFRPTESEYRRMRILSSVVYRLPFILGPFSWPQTNTTSGSKKRGQVNIGTSADPGTVVGQLLVTSRNKVYAYVTLNGKQLLLSGTFSVVRRSLTLRGTAATAERVSIKIFQK